MKVTLLSIKVCHPFSGGEKEIEGFMRKGDIAPCQAEHLSALSCYAALALFSSCK